MNKKKVISLLLIMTFCGTTEIPFNHYPIIAHAETTTSSNVDVDMSTFSGTKSIFRTNGVEYSVPFYITLNGTVYALSRGSYVADHYDGVTQDVIIKSSLSILTDGTTLNIPVTSVKQTFGRNSSSVLSVVVDVAGAIEDTVFYNCPNLSFIKIGNHVTSIDSSTFLSCPSLTGNLIVPDSVTTINTVFSNMSHVEIGLITDGLFINNTKFVRRAPNITATINNQSLSNRSSDGNVIVKGWISPIDYFYTTDGSEPTTTNGTKMTTNTINLVAPDTDNTAYVTVKVKGIKNGYVSTNTAQAIIEYKGKALSQTLNDVTNSIINFKNNMFVANNATTQTDFELALNNLITNPNISLDVTDFNVRNATRSADGELTCNILINDNSTGDKNTFNYLSIIPKLSATFQTSTELKTSIQNSINEMEITNNTTELDIKNLIDRLNVDKNLKYVFTNPFTIINSTDTIQGSMNFGLMVYDPEISNSAITFDINKVIPVIDSSSKDAVIKKVLANLQTLVVNSSTNKTDLYNKLTNGVNTSLYPLDIELFKNDGYTMSASLIIGDWSKDISAIIKNPSQGYEVGSSSENLTLDATIIRIKSTLSKINFDKNATVDYLFNLIKDEVPSTIGIEFTNFENNNTTGKISTNIRLLYVTGEELKDSLSYQYDISGLNTSTNGTNVDLTNKLTLEDALNKINSKINGFKYTYQTDANDILNLVKNEVGTDINISISNFENNTKTGKVCYTISVSKNNDSLSKDILGSYSITGTNGDTNNTGGNNTGSTGGSTGNIGGTGSVTTGSAVTINTDLERAYNLVSNYLDDYKARESSTKYKIKNKLDDLLSNSNISVDISDWNKDDGDDAYLSFTVTLTDKYNNKRLVDFDKRIKDSDNDDDDDDDDHISTSTINKLINLSNKNNNDNSNMTWSDGGYSNYYENEIYKGTFIQSNGNGGILNTGVSGLNYAYVYLPDLGKYININSENIIQGSLVIIPKGKYTIYYVSKLPVDNTKIINQGWLNDYYVSKDGLQTGWLKNNNNWYYLDVNDKTKTKGWKYINSSWYIFNNDGVMLTGWQKQGGIWYYMNDSDGDMVTGWRYINNNWYFFNNDGSMAHDTTVGGYSLGSNGTLI